MEKERFERTTQKQLNKHKANKSHFNQNVLKGSDLFVETLQAKMKCKLQISLTNHVILFTV